MSASVHHLDQFVRLNVEARADMEWRYRFIANWNGTATNDAHSDITITSDASGNWGCGAYVDKQWFMLPWMGPIKDLHITVKELAPIVVAAICGERIGAVDLSWQDAITQH